MAKAAVAPSSESMFVSITRLRIRALRFMPAFALDIWRTRVQVTRAEGYVDGALLADQQRTFWTMTLWRSRDDMRRYMTGGAHLKAMPRLMHWCDEASIVHWHQPHCELPDWIEADRRMRAEGRVSKVRHPSRDHAMMGFAPPRPTGSVPIRPVDA